MVELAEQLKELEKLETEKLQNMSAFEALDNVKEARHMIKLHEEAMFNNNRRIATLENIINDLKKPYDKEDERLAGLIHAKKIEIAKAMEAEGVKRYAGDGMTASMKVRHFDNINDFTIANQKTLKADAEVIEKINEYAPDVVKVSQSININKLTKAIKEGTFLLVDGKVITQDGEPLGVELEKKEEYTLRTKYEED